MKDRILDANFPRTADHRVYHLGLRAGEVTNRIVTVGSASRAQSIASFLDATPKPFTLSSERGFITITGRYKAVPISIISIGMGSPNVDFFIREVRESLSGDMVVVRSVFFWFDCTMRFRTHDRRGSGRVGVSPTYL